MSSGGEGSAAIKETTAPEPDDPRKPRLTPDLPKRSWRYTARMAVREFRRDDCPDLAAALTFYAIGAVFPAFVVLAALVGLIGEGPSTAETIVDLINDLGQPDVAEQLQGPITELAESRGAGLALVLGTLGALWSASGYVGAFGRAMNRIYEVDEGRPALKLRALNLLVSACVIVGAALLLVGATMSGAVAEQVGDRIGVSDGVLTAWSIAKWPAMLVVLALMVAVLYYATPNVATTAFPLDERGRRAGDHVVGRRLAGVRCVRADVRQLRPDLRLARRHDRVVALALAHQHGPVVRCRVRRRARTCPAARGRHRSRADAAAPPRDTVVSEKAAATLASDIAAGRALRQRAQRDHDPERAEAGARHNDRAASAIALFALAVMLGRRRDSSSHAR